MPWDPMRDLRVLQERLERLSTHHPDSWTPPIDVYETEDRYVVAAELPGLSRESIELALEDSRLTIRGQRIDRATMSAATSSTSTRSSVATAHSRARSSSARRSTRKPSRQT